METTVVLHIESVFFDYYFLTQISLQQNSFCWIQRYSLMTRILKAMGDGAIFFLKSEVILQSTSFFIKIHKTSLDERKNVKRSALCIIYTTTKYERQ